MRKGSKHSEDSRALISARLLGNPTWNFGVVGWKKTNTKYINVLPPYEKVCPKCGRRMVYTNKYSLVYSLRDNKICQHCSNSMNNVGVCRKGIKRPDSWRRNLRLAAIRQIKKQYSVGQVFPFFNIKACELITEYGNQHGYKFQHAMNGGEFFIEELGYWVDGYDKEKNVVIEVDERHHFDYHGNLRAKDVVRQKEIENHLNCKFIRLKLE